MSAECGVMIDVTKLPRPHCHTHREKVYSISRKNVIHYVRGGDIR